MKRILTLLLLLSSVNIFSQILPETQNHLRDTTEKYGTMVIADGTYSPEDSTYQELENNSLKAGDDDMDNSGKKGVVVFPSPTAAHLLKLQNNDVHLYSGRVTQNIPLVNFKSYDISVPISLNYSSSGVKLNEIASWVGIGWNVKAGGQISRVMRGLPDEYNGQVWKEAGNYINSYGYMRYMEKLKSDVHDPYTYLSGSNVINELTEEEQEELLKNAMIFDKDSDEAWDTQPDWFYFNFGKYSGRFVFNGDGEIITIPKYNFDISYETKDVFIEFYSQGYVVYGMTYSIIADFTVTTDDGYKYTFGKGDESAVELTSYNTHTKHFYFIHKNEVGAYRDSYDEVGMNSYINNNNTVYFYSKKDPYLYNDTELYDETTIYDFPSTWHLTEIVSPKNNSVTFNYSMTWPRLNYIENKGEKAQATNFEPGPDDKLVSPIQNPSQSLSIFRTKVTHDNVVLESIVGSNGNRIEFKTETNRPDLTNGKRLTQIQVYDLIGSLIKKYDFKYTDTHSNEPRFVKYYIGEKETGTPYDYYDTPLYDEWFTDAEAYKTSEESRMFLSELIESSPGDEIIKPYKFSYNDQNLPPRFSPKQDQWGYFNINSYYPMPYISYGGISNFTIWSKYYNIDGEDVPFESNIGKTTGADENNMKFGMLKTIEYPTGGTKDFNYEPNTNNFGGLRINSVIRNYGNNKIETTEYVYEGNDFVTPNRYFQWSYRTSLFSEDGLKELNITSSPNTYIPGNLGYAKVIVKNGLGKTVYHYDDLAAKPDLLAGLWDENNEEEGIPTPQDGYPFQPSTDNFWQRGLLTDVKTYIESNEVNPVGHVKNDYIYTTSDPMIENCALIPGNYMIFEINKYECTSYKYECTEFPDDCPGWVEKTGDYCYSWLWESSLNLRARFLVNVSDNYKLVQTTETTYDVNDLENKEKAIVTVTEYDHNDQLMVKEIKKYDAKYIPNSDPPETYEPTGTDKFKTKIKYPVDFPGNTVLNSMSSTEKHMLNYPIETIKYKNDKVIQASITSYKYSDGENEDGTIIPNALVVPFETYSLETDEPLTDYSPASSNLSPEARCKVEGSIDDYDTKGNILQYHKTNGRYTSYLWAYNQSYPIAKIENATYANVETALASIGSSVENIETKSLATDDETQLLALFEALRATDEMTNALITSYTYGPLVGMKTETDANDKTIYYEYDELGRLKTIRNADNDILKDFTYQYKN